MISLFHYDQGDKIIADDFQGINEFPSNKWICHPIIEAEEVTTPLIQNDKD